MQPSMTLKANLLAELQKLRISREKPKVLQEQTWIKAKKEKQNKHLIAAQEALAALEEE
jgi:hypothetical protein